MIGHIITSDRLLKIQFNFNFNVWILISVTLIGCSGVCRLGNMITNDSGDLRTAGVVQVLDVGCGVSSFSAFLLPLGIQTMSFAPKDGHENQIQFSLERGIGAMISAIATKQLPYPSNSFEMVHCSRCRVDWHENGNCLLYTSYVLDYW